MGDNLGGGYAEGRELFHEEEIIAIAIYLCNYYIVLLEWINKRIITFFLSYELEI